MQLFLQNTRIAYLRVQVVFIQDNDRIRVARGFNFEVQLMQNPER
jgi:hypothetical protein